jgi:long-chain acyl-CoA synthetase
MNVAHWLERAARLHPHRPAIGAGMAVYCTYREFALHAARGAAWLRREGVQPGDRVALFMANRPDYLELMWAVWWAGAVVVPINAKLHPREAAWICGHSRSTLAFSDDENCDALMAALEQAEQPIPVHTCSGFVLDPRFAPLPIQTRADTDPAWLFYTSGTTGRPKGVTLAARQLRLMSLSYLASVQPVAPGDTMLHPAPLSHGSGLYHLPYVLQGGVNVVPASGGFDGEESLALAAHWRNASFFAAPTMVRRLVDAVKTQPVRPDGLATIVYGGGPMYLADIEEALQLVGPHFAQIYGQGECPMTITVLPREAVNDYAQPNRRERLASVGFACPMVELSLRDENGNEAPPGGSGEVCVRSDLVMDGYWQDEAATRGAIVDGWLRTGDVGRLDADGFLTLLDRTKDLIISGGTNVYPREVEEVLLTHEAVAQAAVIGRPDPEWGEVVVAYVVARAPVEPAALDAHCLETIARFKRPRHYRFVESLPTNHYGKVLKTVLRDMEIARSAAGAEP